MTIPFGMTVDAYTDIKRKISMKADNKIVIRNLFSMNVKAKANINDRARSSEVFTQ